MSTVNKGEFLRKILFLFLLLVLLVCVGGCKKDPDKAKVDDMVKSAEDAGVPVSRAELEKMVKAQKEMGTKPASDISFFLLALGSKDFEKAYSCFDENIQKVWAKDDFVKDMNRLFDDIGQKWKPHRMEFMNYPRQNKPVSTFVYQLTDDFQSPFTMNMMATDSGTNLKINNLKLLFPYQGDYSDEMKGKAVEFLSTIQELDVENNRKMVAAEYRDIIKLSMLQHIKEILWDDANKEIIIGEVEESIINGKSFCRVLADSQLHPLMKLEILIEKSLNEVKVIGFHMVGRMRAK